MTDRYVKIVFDYINTATFAYVGIKLIKNPQVHLVILCFCFGFAALANSIMDTLYQANG